MASSVLDASAILVQLLNEPGRIGAGAAIAAGAAVGTVNLSEVASRLLRDGMSEEDVRAAIEGLQLDVIPFDEELAYRTAMLQPLTRHLGLSLGDRTCLALAERLRLPVLTADRAWAGLSLGITIQVIR